jgi:Helix-turn-helix domain
MSIQMLSRVWKDQDVRTPGDRLVLLALAECHNPKFGCFPSIERLMVMTQLSERGVGQSIARLVANGKIIKIRGGGRGHRNNYQLEYLVQKTLHGVRGLDHDTAPINPASHDNKPRKSQQQTPQVTQRNPAGSAPFSIGENGNYEASIRKGTVTNRKREGSYPKNEAAKNNSSTLHSKHPTIEEFVDHGKDRGATDQDCRDLFQIWSDSDWHDGYGNKISSWKGKLTTFISTRRMPSDRRRANSTNSNTSKQKGFCDL